MPTAAARLAAPLATPAVPRPAAATVTAVAAAAFRVQLGTAATASEASVPGAFRADVSGYALAAMARTFDFDAGVIAVLDHAQVERCPVLATPARGGAATLACAALPITDLPAARRPPAR